MKTNLILGIFNAASNFSYRYQKRVKETENFFKKNNLNYVLGELTFKKGNYRSGSIIERANEFNNLLKKSNIMLSMIGGWNSSSILDYIDFDLIKSKSIKIVGCSDTTSILLAVYKKTGMPVYYGPSFLMSYHEQKYIQDFNFNALVNRVILEKEEKLILPEKITFDNFEKFDWKDVEIKNKKLIKNKIKVINKNDNIKTIKGRLLGGNLNTMIALIGTEFMPEFKKGDILFIEDSYLQANVVEREMSVLKNARILEKISCVIIGLLEKYNDLGSKRKYHEILMEFLDKDIPIIYDFPCSHIQPSTVLKIGSTMKITFKKDTIEFEN